MEKSSKKLQRIGFVKTSTDLLSGIGEVKEIHLLK